MRTDPRLLLAMTLAATALSGPSAAWGVVIASDNAGDPVYADGWQIGPDSAPETGDNGGFGFGPWRGLGSYGFGPTEIDTTPAEESNSLGAPAFRVGNGFDGFFVTRPFANPLGVGQSFSMDFDSFPIAPEGGQILISFQAADAIEDGSDTRFSFYAYYYSSGGLIFGSDNWTLSSQTANNNLNGGAPLPPEGSRWKTDYTTTDASDGFTLTLDITATDAFRFRIVDDNVTKVDVSGALLSNTAGQLINSVDIFGDNVTSPSFDQDVYFNNLQITGPAGLTGDFNGDAVVNAADYTLWRDNLGAPTEAPINNNGDGANGVDQNDYTLWKQHYGQGAQSTALATPEPCSLLLTTGSLFAWIASRSRRS